MSNHDNKRHQKLGAPSFRAAPATRKALAVLLSLCVLLSLMLMAVSAAGSHDHSGWTAITMGSTHIKIGDNEQSSNTLPAGSYYLDADLTVPMIVTGAVNLCLNGHNVTVSSGDAVTVSSGASLSLYDCAAGSTGKIACTSTSFYDHGIENNGTLTLHSGAVEGNRYGVFNSSGSVFTMTGGSVTATGSSGRGVYNYSSSSVFRLSGGAVSGGQYGIVNEYSGSHVYLSGTPSVTGGTAGIYTADLSSNIYADDGAAENPTAYSGEAISLRYSSHYSGRTAVHHVTEATKDKFTLTNDNYELEFVQENGILQLQGKPQDLTWYDINDEQLTGDSYPASVPYGAYLESDQLPNPPAVENEIFLGWLYKKDGDSEWNSRYWSDGSIYSATSFKADYIDSFSGSGTEADPYQLATAADLQKLATVIGKGIDAYNNSNVWYQMTADIDLSAVCGSDESLGSWTPIGGGSSHYFQANLDGNGKTISNLYIDTSSGYQGLFYGLSGVTVKNLTLTGAVTAGSNSSALAGYISSSCTLENVDVTGVTLTPYGYTTDENRTMAYKIKIKQGYDDQNATTIDIQGNYKNNWVKTTYSNYGYEVATANLTGAAVTASAEFINGGKYVQLGYTVTAGETAITDGKLAVHADIQIGDNDSAAVEVIQDAAGKVIGLKMVDTHSSCSSKGAQFNLYFDGTGGVTPVDTYWFGYFGDRNDPNDTYGYIYFAPLNGDTKSSSDHGTYEQVDGVYTKFSNGDSGFAVSWQNISLDAGQSKTYSFVLGVGEKAEPPQWNSSANAVSLTLAADAAQNDRLVNVSARVRDEAGLTDTLYYSVDGGEGEVLGSVEADGSTMKPITGQLDLSSYADGTYTFSFWVVNSKGAASASVARTITITANGIEGLDSGSEPAHTHSWSDAWSSDATHHWHACTADGCDVTDNSGKDGYGEHVWDDDADTTCNTCGYTRQIAHEHAWADAWSSSDTHHWHACANCDEKKDAAAHTFYGTSCTVCGYEKPVTPPAPSLPINRPIIIDTKPGYETCGSGKACPIHPFTDTSAAAWYHDGVHYCLEQGLMGGVGADQFNPDGDSTRGMIVTILYRMQGEPRVSSDAAAWWSDARVWAMENGISDGSGMDGKITREQLAVMLYRYAKMIGADTSASADLDKFTDSGFVSRWAKAAMRWAVGADVVTGKPGSRLDPKGLATRAEVATMFMRFDRTIG